MRWGTPKRINADRANRTNHRTRRRTRSSRGSRGCFGGYNSCHFGSDDDANGLGSVEKTGHSGTLDPKVTGCLSTFSLPFSAVKANKLQLSALTAPPDSSSPSRVPARSTSASSVSTTRSRAARLPLPRLSRSSRAPSSSAPLSFPPSSASSVSDPSTRAA